MYIFSILFNVFFTIMTSLDAATTHLVSWVCLLEKERKEKKTRKK